ncbi:MAG: hypothetical protein JNJ55_11010 [Betaproteobacteria bacterium]|nr:hypothetical protein [Betaproteobacteria bacterium]
MKTNLRTLAAGVAATFASFAMAQTPPPAPAAPATTASPAAPGASTPAAPPGPPPPPAQEETQKIGKETKVSIDKVLDLEKQDNGCLINFKHEKRGETVELALAEFCGKKPSIKGQTLHFVYKMQTVLADECLGNPKCKKTEERAVIVEANPLK